MSGHNLPMHEEDVKAFVARDWVRVQELKESYWAKRKRTLTAVEALRLGGQLRRHALARRPDWPSEEERREDLAVHVRVSEGLGRVSAGPRS